MTRGKTLLQYEAVLLNNETLFNETQVNCKQVSYNSEVDWNVCSVDELNKNRLVRPLLNQWKWLRVYDHKIVARLRYGFRNLWLVIKDYKHKICDIWLDASGSKWLRLGGP